MGDVYFVPVKTKDQGQRSQALGKLLERVSPLMAYKSDECVPVKLTIGDSSCIHHVSPQHVQSVVQVIQNKKAKPFLFDTGVIYHGQRQNAVDHLTLVQHKGFSHFQVGAPFIVADGLFGQDGKEYVINSPHIQKVRVPSFVGMLESLLVLSHATGHIVSGFAGAVKNVAMGMSARATKQVQHSSLKPSIIAEKCTACGCCIRICPAEAICLDPNNKARIDQTKCIGCGECLCACQFNAVEINWDEDVDIFCQRMAEVAQWILSKFKNKFFITFAFDITQECDCISTKDDKLVSRDIGILASDDIVSVDQAVCDLMSDEVGFFKQHDVYKRMLRYGQEIGLGRLDYELIKI